MFRTRNKLSTLSRRASPGDNSGFDKEGSFTALPKAFGRGFGGNTTLLLIHFVLVFFSVLFGRCVGRSEGRDSHCILRLEFRQVDLGIPSCGMVIQAWGRVVLHLDLGVRSKSEEFVEMGTAVTGTWLYAPIVFVCWYV